MIESKRKKLLKSCYSLALDCKLPVASKEIIEKKIQGLSDNIPVFENDSLPASEMQTFSELLYSLTLEKNNSNYSSISFMINLPDSEEYSGERSFLQALLALRTSANQNQRNIARRYIQNALQEVPNDPRYVALAEILLSVDKIS